MSSLVTIQIVNFHTKEYLSDCLDSIKQDIISSNIEVEVNILNNDITEDLGSIQSKYKDYSFYNISENKGFGHGQNILSNKANGKYLLILNPDIIFIEEKTIKRLLDTFKINSQIGVVGPELLTSDNQIQEWDHGELTNKKAQKALSVGSSSWKVRKRPSRSAWVSGACFLIENNLFKEVNGFDEKFFMYKEEEDLCWRIRNNNRFVYYNPKVKVKHIGTESKKDQYLQPSVDYFIEKHFNKNNKGNI